MTTPVVLPPGGGEGNAVGTISFTIKADSASTQGQYSLVEAGGGVFATPHIHHSREEAFYVLEGEVVFLAGEDTVSASAGSFLLVPRGTMHGFRSVDETARLLILHSPGGFERFFQQLAAAIEAGTMDTAFRDKLAEEFELTYHDDVTF